MQIIAPPRSAARTIDYLAVVWGLIIGTVLLTVAGVVAYVTLATPFLARLSVGAPLTASRAVIGILAWTFALTAPAGFGLIGFLRIVGALEPVMKWGPRTPTVRAARALGDDMHVASSVMLPDGRPVSELVIGPFGAAVISAMAPAKSIRRQHQTWEQRMADGRWRSIESPLERTVRDAERVRRWFGSEDRDFIIKVHAAIVDPSRSVERTSTCAVITPDQIPAWLASLPAQRGMSAERREQLVERIRSLM